MPARRAASASPVASRRGIERIGVGAGRRRASATGGLRGSGRGTSAPLGRHPAAAVAASAQEPVGRGVRRERPRASDPGATAHAGVSPSSAAATAPYQVSSSLVVRPSDAGDVQFVLGAGHADIELAPVFVHLRAAFARRRSACVSSVCCALPGGVEQERPAVVLGEIERALGLAALTACSPRRRG